ncbi:MAG: hypothetical protein ACYTBJ_25680, partial [Planctomycetota bacterium]
LILGGVVTFMVALLLGMTTWNFAATSGAVQKDEHQTVHEKLDQKLDKIYDKMIELHTKGDKE